MRVALIGDAAACVSLLAGEGTGLATAEAYVLAGERARREGDHATAFRRYENRLRTCIGPVADWFIGRDLKDDIELPDYKHPRRLRSHEP